MMRTLALTLLVTFFFGMFGSNDCEAQLFRSRQNRPQPKQIRLAAPPLYHKPAGHIGTYIPQDYSAPTVFPIESYFENRNPVISRILDGKLTHKYRNPVEVDARYIGGFHQSHFNNIGIPSGDIGIRGNAYNLRTWP